MSVSPGWHMARHCPSSGERLRAMSDFYDVKGDIEALFATTRV